MKELIQKCLKSCVVGRLIYEPLHKLYRLYSVPARRRRLQKCGKEVLAYLFTTFEKHGIPGYAACGTMLGFVRDGGFMLHDDDIDVAVLPGEWSPARVLKTMLSENFEYVFGFMYDDKLSEFKLRYKGVPIDFFFYEDDGEHFNSHVYYYLPDVNYPNASANTVIEYDGHTSINELLEVLILLCILCLRYDDATHLVLKKHPAQLDFALVVLTTLSHHNLVTVGRGLFFNTFKDRGKVVVYQFGDDDSDDLLRLHTTMAQRLCQYIGCKVMFTRVPLYYFTSLCRDTRRVF